MLHHFDRHHQGYVLAPTSSLEYCSILDHHMKGIFINHMIDKIITLPLSVLNPKLSKYHDDHKKSLKWSALQVLATILMKI